MVFFRKKILITFTAIFVLAGCQDIYNNFHEATEKVDLLIEQENWKEASKELESMRKEYETKHQWKDFYITENDMTLLMTEIGRLEGAIKTKDKKEAKIQLTTIDTILKDIYYK